MKQFLVRAVMALAIATASVGVAHAQGGHGKGGAGGHAGSAAGGHAQAASAASASAEAGPVSQAGGGPGDANLGQIQPPELGTWTRIDRRFERVDTAYANGLAPMGAIDQR